ncbi:MAG: SirB1 family protein, partial [Comamonas sp.]
MALSFAPPTALDHFKCLVGHDVAFPLLEAAASLAQDAVPDVDIQDVLLQVDSLAQRLLRKIPASASSMQRTFMLNEFFYEKLGFAANANHFSDPSNSYLHYVLATRRGIPISLAVLWLELAASIGLKAEGISFPGHFLVKVYVEEGIIVQDPLTGRGLTQNALAERLEPFRNAWGMAEDEMAPLHMFLAPSTPRDIVERMLRNLHKIHTEDGKTSLLLAVLDRLIVLRPQDWPSYR